MRREFADDRGNASRFKPGLEIRHSLLLLRPFRAKCFQGAAKVLGRVPEIGIVGYIQASQEFPAQVPDPGCPVRERDQLLGLAQPRSRGFALAPRGEVRVAADAAVSDGAVDRPAPGLATDVLLRLAGLGGISSRPSKRLIPKQINFDPRTLVEHSCGQ